MKLGIKSVHVPLTKDSIIQEALEQGGCVCIGMPRFRFLLTWINGTDAVQLHENVNLYLELTKYMCK